MAFPNRELRGRAVPGRRSLRSCGLAIGLAVLCVPARADHAATVEDVTTEVGLSRRIAAAIAKSGLSDQQLGVSVVDVRSGRSIAAHNPALPLDPASNQKLITAAATLAELGADFRMLTGLYGRVENNAVVSGLYLKGYGDPTLSGADMIDLAQQLAARGVRQVDEVIVDGSYFDSAVLPPGFEKQPAEIAPFRAAIGAVSVNANAFALRVGPGAAAGAPAQVAVDAEGHFELSNALITTEGGTPQVVADQNQKADKLLLRLSGSVPLGSPSVTFRRRVESPLYYAGYTLVEALRGLRIQVPRRVRLATLPSGLALLASRRSPPLSEQLSALGKFSDNFTAEMLLKVLAAERVGAPGRTEHGARVAQQVLRRMGVPLSGMLIANGSGLFAPNRVTAAQLTHLLAAVYADPALRPEFVAQLAVAGVDGTLSKRMPALPAPRIVRAKTGTLNDVIALSGYVLGRTPERVFAFSVLANGVRGKQQAARDLADTVAMEVAMHLWLPPRPVPPPTTP